MDRKFDAEKLEKYLEENKEKIAKDIEKMIANMVKKNEIVRTPEYKEWLKNYMASHESADNYADCFYFIAPEDHDNMIYLSNFYDYINELRYGNNEISQYDSNDFWNSCEPIIYFYLDNQLYSIETVYGQGSSTMVFKVTLDEIPMEEQSHIVRI